MKPPPFVYHRPDDLDEALDVLAETGDDGKVLAGGQSLVPLMSMRLAAPGHLIDINRISQLATIDLAATGVRVGATARHAEVEGHDGAFAVQPLLRQALRHVAHPTVRNRGTTVGSIAHADPAGEMTGVLALLGGSVTVRSRSTERTVPATEFFVGPLESAIRPGELATEVFFPAIGDRSGSAWVETSRRNGDYAICGAGAVVTVDESRTVSSARVALISVGPVPVVVDVTEPSRQSTASDTVDCRHVAEAVRAAIEPESDIHATADYRRHLAGELAVRAVREAATRAAEGTP